MGYYGTGLLESSAAAQWHTNYRNKVRKRGRSCPCKCSPPDSEPSGSPSCLSEWEKGSAATVSDLSDRYMC